ncbi:unnamed protein product [Phaedon cochleariae]|uniref:Uncharacterized protein n=1 Tax=Phaedon cochleariae TaxID=80249 RepID=A0A9N9SCL5_PHACE|nr:unnamed protein product [Phaedon cochleariae]
MDIIMDVQGFKIENNKFIVKEFAVFDGVKICHFIFKPPFPLNFLPPNLQKQADWLVRNFHCLEWKDGFIPLHQFRNILKKLSDGVDLIHIKGKEKAGYIRWFTSVPVVEFDEQPILQQSEPQCFYHMNSNSMCSLNDVFICIKNEFVSFHS